MTDPFQCRYRNNGGIYPVYSKDFSNAESQLMQPEGIAIELITQTVIATGIFNDERMLCVLT